jgi:hypothetical protein
MSFGFRPAISRTAPSTSTIGSLELLIDEPPRIRNFGAEPGVASVVATCKPAIRPFMPSPTRFTGMLSRVLPSIFEIAEVTVLRVCVPYPTTTTSSSTDWSSCIVTSITERLPTGSSRSV